jgi:hypothetical protein
MSVSRESKCPVGRYEPCLPRPAKEPPPGPGWIHEIKDDGFRILAEFTAWRRAFDWSFFKLWIAGTAQRQECEGRRIHLPLNKFDPPLETELCMAFFQRIGPQAAMAMGVAATLAWIGLLGYELTKVLWDCHLLVAARPELTVAWSAYGVDLENCHWREPGWAGDHFWSIPT